MEYLEVGILHWFVVKESKLMYDAVVLRQSAQNFKLILELSSYLEYNTCRLRYIRI